ncbi:MAG: methionine--tRNA ligase subunit beta [Nanoarchaeota archaeon]|nr:methionine--tRNA ligase subunit beta [Nanoarchaeota archaeon]MBU2459458.1 methionine--tRNA ligase subunit beta [Nanoarchaeota archaeon]
MKKETIPFSDWENLDIRVGKILDAESIENADKLYNLTVDLGKEIGKRTIVAGLKQHYSQEELKGKKCLVLANLEPKKLKGIESQGMILAAINEDENGETKSIKIISPESEVEEGSKVR